MRPGRRDAALQRLADFSSANGDSPFPRARRRCLAQTSSIAVPAGLTATAAQAGLAAGSASSGLCLFPFTPSLMKLAPNRRPLRLGHCCPRLAVAPAPRTERAGVIGHFCGNRCGHPGTGELAAGSGQPCSELETPINLPPNPGWDPVCVLRVLRSAPADA